MYLERNGGWFLMANFIKNFKNQNYYDGFLPQSVLEEMSKKWNGNLEYVY